MSESAPRDWLEKVVGLIEKPAQQMGWAVRSPIHEIIGVFRTVYRLEDRMIGLDVFGNHDVASTMRIWSKAGEEPVVELDYFRPAGTVTDPDLAAERALTALRTSGSDSLEVHSQADLEIAVAANASPTAGGVLAFLLSFSNKSASPELIQKSGVRDLPSSDLSEFLRNVQELGGAGDSHYASSLQIILKKLVVGTRSSLARADAHSDIREMLRESPLPSVLSSDVVHRSELQPLRTLLMRVSPQEILAGLTIVNSICSWWASKLVSERGLLLETLLNGEFTINQTETDYYSEFGAALADLEEANETPFLRASDARVAMTRLGYEYLNANEPLIELVDGEIAVFLEEISGIPVERSAHTGPEEFSSANWTDDPSYYLDPDRPRRLSLDHLYLDAERYQPVVESAANRLFVRIGLDSSDIPAELTATVRRVLVKEGIDHIVHRRVGANP